MEALQESTGADAGLWVWGKICCRVKSEGENYGTRSGNSLHRNRENRCLHL